MRLRLQHLRWGSPGGRLKNVGAGAKKWLKVLEVSGGFCNFAADIKPQII